MLKFQSTKKMAFLPFLLIISACVNSQKIENGFTPVFTFHTSLQQSSIELVLLTRQNYFSNISGPNLAENPDCFISRPDLFEIFSSINIDYNSYIIQCFNSWKRSIFPTFLLIAILHFRSIMYQFSSEAPTINS
jgi:hypothetical protein